MLAVSYWSAYYPHLETVPIFVVNAIEEKFFDSKLYNNRVQREINYLKWKKFRMRSKMRPT
jgi:hypothetical protein